MVVKTKITPVSDVASKDKKRQVKASFLSMDHTELRIHGAHVGHGGLRNYGSTEHTEDTELQATAG